MLFKELGKLYFKLRYKGYLKLVVTIINSELLKTRLDKKIEKDDCLSKTQDSAKFISTYRV